MKIGILKETKIPIDNRVALTPSQITQLSSQFPNAQFKVQTSDIRAYTDDEYRSQGIDIVEDVSDCDLLLGIKEADIRTLIPEKHYIFFGHIAKRQRYNIPLFKTLLDKRITFSDYEYLVDEDGERLVAFGWFAGVVGIYYTLIGWGKRTGRFSLPKPHTHMTVEEIIDNIRNCNIGDVRILLTGTGRVSQGAQYVLSSAGAKELSISQYEKGDSEKGLVYCVAPHSELVANNDMAIEFSHADFKEHPAHYHSTFDRFIPVTDILLCCHFWGENDPVYLDVSDYKRPDFRIKMIGDVTCDIMGSIKSTLRSSTHDNPFYDYNPRTEKEEPAFSSDSNITVMAVDTCPNALPRITSEYFGEKLIEHVLTPILEKDRLESDVLERATIVENGSLGKHFNYLKDYVDGFISKA